MLKTASGQVRKPFDEMQLVRTHKHLVERFENFKDPVLGFGEPTNIMEVLEEATDYEKTRAAILMNNFIKYHKTNLDETSRADLPVWAKNGLALIAATHVDDLTDKVISEQPLPNRRAKIHYMDINSESAKGQLPPGHRFFDALRGYSGSENYSSEKTLREPGGASGTTDYNLTFDYKPVVPGSIEVTSAAQTIRDDRNGNAVGDTQAAGGGFTNTFDYLNGTGSIRFAVATTEDLELSYVYNIEAAQLLPEWGISIRSIDVEARPRAMTSKWSQQSVMDLMADWGVDAEPTILDAGAKLIYAEKFKHVVNHLFKVASGGTLIFDNTTPSGISYQDHIDSFGILLSRLQHEIWKNTQRVRPNVAVMAPDVIYAFQYTKGFKGEGVQGTDALAGPKVVGTLTNHGITCIVDPTFPPGSAVLTYRGNEIVNTAAILGMYIPLYRSPLHVQGFHKDVSLLTEYVIHVVNPEMLGTISIINL